MEVTAAHPRHQALRACHLPLRGLRSGAHRLVALVAFLLVLPAFAQTAPTFPTLTGRVVDAANVIPTAERQSIESRLKAHEDKTTDQVVVATVPSLGGLAVEDYANRLFRIWGLGRKAKNNGVLLLVAPADRKARLEVGYGLEGALTDALSGVIVRTVLAPRFKAGDFAGGISAGVDAILSVVAGDADEWQRRAEVRRDDSSPIELFTIVFVAIVLFLLIRALMRSGGGPGRPHRRRGGSWVVLPTPGGGGWSGGFGGGGGGFGGGFSGGGGSSGGGGASGSW